MVKMRWKLLYLVIPANAGTTRGEVDKSPLSYDLVASIMVAIYVETGPS